MASKLDKHKDEIIELCKQGLAYEKIGKKFGVSGVAVSYWCQINGIKKVKCRLGKGLKLDKYRDEVIELCKQELPYKEIGKKLGVSLQTVLRWCQKKGIDKVKCKGGFPSKLDKHKDEIVDFCKQGLKYKEIGEKFGVNRNAVKYWSLKNGIDKVKCNYVSSLDKHKDEIVDFCKQGVSYKELGKKFGVSDGTILRWCRKNRIKKVNCKLKRTWTRKKTYKPCEICGFARFTQRAHIIEGANGGINGKGNIVHLCPNHHELFDRGLLTKEEFYSINWDEKDEASARYAFDHFGTEKDNE